MEKNEEYLFQCLFSTFTSFFNDSQQCLVPLCLSFLNDCNVCIMQYLNYIIYYDLLFVVVA